VEPSVRGHREDPNLVEDHSVKDRLQRAALAIVTLAALVLALGAPTRWGQ